MINAMGRKKKVAASTHRLIEEVPLCAAAAIQRGPSTAAMLNSSTSQKPIARRNWDFGLAVSRLLAVAILWLAMLQTAREFSSIRRDHSTLPTAFQADGAGPGGYSIAIWTGLPAALRH